MVFEVDNGIGCQLSRAMVGGLSSTKSSMEFCASVGGLGGQVVYLFFRQLAGIASTCCVYRFELGGDNVGFGVYRSAPLKSEELVYKSLLQLVDAFVLREALESNMSEFVAHVVNVKEPRESVPIDLGWGMSELQC